MRTVIRALLSLVFAIQAVTFAGCHSSDEQAQGLLAEVGEKKLFAKDISDLIKTTTSVEDSISLVKRYTANWVKEQLVLQMAELNLPVEKKNVNRQLEDYKNSLLIFTYEKELVKQRLDTAVTREEIQVYYNNNKKNFELKDYIVKVMYFKVEKTTPGIEQARRILRNPNEDNLRELEDYCRKYATNFFLDVDVWLYFDDLLKEVPIKTYDKARFLKSNRFVELEDDEHNYLLLIVDYLLKDGTSPLSLERDKIKSIILNERKLALISKMKKDIFEDAIAKKKFKVYIES